MSKHYLRKEKVMWYVKLNDTIKMLGFISFHTKSPIVYEKLLFSKPSKSDLAGALVYIQKKHLKRCFLSNGAISKKVPRLSAHDISAACA